MKVLYMGTPDFAVVILEKIIKEGHEVIAVVTQPDKPKGRKKELSCPPVKEFALKQGIAVYQPTKVRDEEFLNKVGEMAPEIIVVAAFGQLLPKALLDIPTYGCINVHGSLLPKYRGAAPIQYSIIDGETVTGVTIQYMDVKLDEGDIILQDQITLNEEETGGSLHDRLAVLGAELLVKAMELIKDDKAIRIKQDDNLATFVRVIDKEMGNIDFSLPATHIERLIRGLNPWPSAFTYINDKSLKIWKATVEEVNTKAEAGEIIELRKEGIVVMTGEKALVIIELQLEGKKRMTADAFLRGNNVTVGMILGR